jgi:hypothetical protein
VGGLEAVAEELDGAVVFVKEEEGLVGDEVLVDGLGVDLEDVADIVEVNEATVDVVLGAIHAVEEPIKTVADVGISGVKSHGIVLAERGEDLLIGDGSFGVTGWNYVIGLAVVPVEHANGLALELAFVHVVQKLLGGVGPFPLELFAAKLAAFLDFVNGFEKAEDQGGETRDLDPELQFGGGFGSDEEHGRRIAQRIRSQNGGKVDGVTKQEIQMDRVARPLRIAV